MIVLPVVLPNVIWVLTSQKTTGKVEGIGTSTGLSFGRDTYAYVSFQVNNDTFYFQGLDDNYKEGDVVTLLYHRKKPEEAKIASFYSLWGKTIAYIGAPFIFWLISFFAHDLVPKGSRIRVGKKPFLKLIHPHKRML